LKGVANREQRVGAIALTELQDRRRSSQYDLEATLDLRGSRRSGPLA